MVENSRVEGVSRIRWNDILNSLYSLDLLDSFILPPKIDMCLILKLKSLLESLIRNQQVVGSNPIPGSYSTKGLRLFSTPSFFASIAHLLPTPLNPNI
jgi:hypothetical protein